MESLRLLASALLLIATFLWTNCAMAERPPQAPPVRKCFCEGCQCGPDCRCTSSACACPTCKRSLQVQPFGNPEELPVRIVLFTAPAWCAPCRQMHPAWTRVAASSPVPMEVVDIDDNPEFARAQGVRSVPQVIVMRGDRAVVRYRAGAMTQGQLEAVVREAGK